MTITGRYMPKVTLDKSLRGTTRGFEIGNFLKVYRTITKCKCGAIFSPK